MSIVLQMALGGGYGFCCAACMALLLGRMPIDAFHEDATLVSVAVMSVLWPVTLPLFGMCRLCRRIFVAMHRCEDCGHFKHYPVITTGRYRPSCDATPHVLRLLDEDSRACEKWVRCDGFGLGRHGMVSRLKEAFFG